MTALSDFWLRVLAEGEALPGERFAFAMDGPHGKGGACPDMRKYVGLGECDCCDYCRPLPDSDRVLLIEITRMKTRKQNYQREFARMRLGLEERDPLPDEDAALADKNGGEYAGDRVVWRNRLKTYGGALVLCRFAAQCAEFSALVSGKKICFLFADCDTTKEEDETDLEYWSKKLLVNLKNLLSPMAVEDVRVVRFADLARELPSDDALPRP